MGNYCDKDCCPMCINCIYVVLKDNKPVNCSRYNDAHHKSLAEYNNYCRSFNCKYKEVKEE